jgi:uncharacterized membrane protein
VWQLRERRQIVAEGWASLLDRWTDAGVLDELTAARIRIFELESAGPNRLSWPIRLTLAFGALMLGAGVLLFVSAHWNTLSPAARFGLVLLLVAVFHAAASAAAGRFAPMASALHTVGTVTLGAGIYLAGQIFNLDEHWPSGLMLWTFGAAAAWLILREWSQMALAAVLAPVWLVAEWSVATELAFHFSRASVRVSACGIFLLTIAYFTAACRDRSSTARRALVWLGGIGLLPAALFLATAVPETLMPPSAAESTGLMAIGWSVALGLPMLLAFGLRGTSAWPNLAATIWTVALLGVRGLGGDVAVYAWWALGASGLTAWGVREGHRGRINMGSAMFAATVLTFYFSHVMGKFGRSISLVGLGLLSLGGGWALERVRRELVLRVQGGEA